MGETGRIKAVKISDVRRLSCPYTTALLRTIRMAWYHAIYGTAMRTASVLVSAAPRVKNCGCYCPSMMNIITIPYIAMDSTMPTKMNTFDWRAGFSLITARPAAPT